MDVKDVQAKITEIDKNIKELTYTREVLQKQLETTFNSEAFQKEEQTKKALKSAIIEIWYVFYSEDDNSNAEKRLNEEADLERLYDWIGYDIKAALKKSKMKGLVNIKTIIKDLPEVNAKLDEYVKSAEIRLDFSSALSKAKKGRDLAPILDYALSPDDILRLMELHKKNCFRGKISDLLDHSCSFYENSLLKAGKYEELEHYCKTGEYV